ncbi:unnamed protein product [Amoebophrya sp. A25]|nr:unnamed protein product [Amoebophrya sp. A25]|eukprot:GSA25T00003380001.1
MLRRLLLLHILIMMQDQDKDRGKECHHTYFGTQRKPVLNTRD